MIAYDRDENDNNIYYSPPRPVRASRLRKRKQAATAQCDLVRDAQRTMRALRSDIGLYFESLDRRAGFYAQRFDLSSENRELSTDNDDLVLRTQCPFEHVQHTSPPFVVNVLLGVWKCHACGKGGWITEFYAEERRRDAHRVGLPMPHDLRVLKDLVLDIRRDAFRLDRKEREDLSWYADIDAQASELELRQQTDERIVFGGPLFVHDRTGLPITMEDVRANQRDYWQSSGAQAVVRALAARGITERTLLDVGVFPPGEWAYFPEADARLPTLTVPYWNRDHTILVGMKHLGFHEDSGRILKRYARGSQPHLLDHAYLAQHPDEWIILCEGEPDALLLRSLGWVATTGAGGCGTWKPYISEYFRGRCIALCYDSDKEGRKGCEKVRKALQGIARSIVVLDLYPENDGLDKDHKDVTDFLIADRHTDDEFAALMRRATGYLASESAAT